MYKKWTLITCTNNLLIVSFVTLSYLRSPSNLYIHLGLNQEKNLSLCFKRVHFKETQSSKKHKAQGTAFLICPGNVWADSTRLKLLITICICFFKLYLQSTLSIYFLVRWPITFFIVFQILFCGCVNKGILMNWFSCFWIVYIQEIENI